MRKPRRRTNATANLSPKELLARGKNLLSQNNFKDAISCFKQLIKVEGDQWQDYLVQSYWGRAEELANKKMFKEAVILWENANRLQPVPLSVNKALFWMFKANQHPKALVCFFKHEPHIQEQTPTDYETISEFIAAQLLIDNAKMRPGIPEGSPWLAYCDAANQALTAYVEGDFAEVDVSLRKIPLRSGFKPFRLILKSLITGKTDPQKAVGLIEKIAENSPFYGLAQVARSFTLEKKVLLQGLGSHTLRQQQLIATLVGVSKDHINLFVRLNDPSKDNIIPLLLDHENLFETDKIQKCCYDLLLENELLIPRFERKFGKLLPWQQFRLSALAEEKEESFYDSYDHWMGCIGRLRVHSKEKDNNLKIALIYRRVADRELYGDVVKPKEAISHLEDSLKLDADDKETWLRVMQFYKKQGPSKLFYQWVDKGVKQFSNDSSMLTMAMDTAFEKGTFVKAARLGLRVLEVDPINTYVRQKLVNAHISQAWKKWDDGQSPLALKELSKARSFNYLEKGVDWCRIHQGFLALKMQETEKGLNLLKEVMESIEPNVVFFYQILLEGGLRKISIEHLEPYRKQMSLYNRKAPLLDQVVEIMKHLSKYSELGVGTFEPVELFKIVPNYLKKAAQLEYDHMSLRLVCEVIDNYYQYPLLKLFALSGEKKYPQQPIFSYFRIFAQSKGEISKVSDEDRYKLENAAKDAQKEGDFPAIKLIKEFLGYSAGGCTCGRCNGGYDFYDDDDDDDLFDDDFDDIFGGGFEIPEGAIPKQLQQILAQLLTVEMLSDFKDLETVDDSVLEKRVAKILKEKRLPLKEGPIYDSILKSAIQEIRRKKPQRIEQQKPPKIAPQESPKETSSPIDIFKYFAELFK